MSISSKKRQYEAQQVADSIETGTNELINAATNALNSIDKEAALADARNAFNEWYAGKQNEQNQFDVGQLVSMGLDPDRAQETIGAPDGRPYIMSEAERRFTDGNGNILAPWDWQLTGVSQTTTPDAAKNLYDMNFGFETSSGDTVDRGFVSNDMIDNGAYEGRTAEKMTGPQYRKYVEWGLPGRSLDDISDDPNVLYDKQYEMENYGFIPYLPTRESIQTPVDFFDMGTGLLHGLLNTGKSPSFHNQATIQRINDLYSDFEGLRRDNVDFTLTGYDGETYSGSDFIKSFEKQSSTLQDQFENLKDYLIEERMSPYDIPLGYNADEDKLEYLRDDNGASYWLHVDPLFLSDGTAIRADDAINLMIAINSGDADEHIDYGPLNWNNPDVQMPDVLTDEGRAELPNWITSGKIAPWLFDMLLGSAPFFYMPTGIIQGAGKASSELEGIDPTRRPADHTYRLISESPNNNLATEMAVGSAIMPFTEHLWGPLGTRGVNILGNRIGNALVGRNIFSNPATKKPLVRLFQGALGEAAEEIPGNLTEELERSGAQDYFKDTVSEVMKETGAQEVLDENGNPLRQYDSTGRPIYVDTDLGGRTENFIHDIPESAFGGFILGGSMGSTRLPSYYREYNKNIEEEALKAAKQKVDAVIESLPADIQTDYYDSAMASGITDLSVLSDRELFDEEQMLNELLNSGELDPDGLDDIIARYTAILNEINDRENFGGGGSFGGQR